MSEKIIAELQAEIARLCEENAVLAAALVDLDPPCTECGGTGEAEGPEEGQFHQCSCEGPRVSDNAKAILAARDAAQRKAGSVKMLKLARDYGLESLVRDIESGKVTV